MSDAADRLAVRDVLVRYADGVDAKVLTRVASCFTSDCAYEGQLGHGTVRDALARLEDAFARYRRTQHYLGVSEMAVGGDRARAQTGCLAWHLGVDGGRLLVGVRYVDDLTREADDWRICRRSVQTLWRHATSA